MTKMPEHSQNLRDFALVFLAGFLIYSKTLFFDFVWDDFYLVVIQDHFRRWENLGKFFTVPFWHLGLGLPLPYHRPLLPLLILIASSFSGINPIGYHTLNLLFYALTGCAYYFFMTRLTKNLWISRSAAALFLLHPIHAEAVSWVCCGSLLLGGLFFIALMEYSSRKLQTSENLKAAFPRLIAAGFLFLTGLMAYHFLLCLIPILFFYDGMNPESGPRKKNSVRLVEYGLYAGLSALFIGFNLLTAHRHLGAFVLSPPDFPGVANVYFSGEALERLLTPLNLLSRYSELLVFPFTLNPESYFKALDFQPSSVMAAVMILGISLLLIQNKETSKPVLFSLVWIFFGLGANLTGAGGFFSDRYAYISSMGFALWLALALGALKKHLESRAPARASLITGICLALILTSYAWKTWTYSDIFKNDQEFWFNAVKLSPYKVRPHLNLGILFEQEGNFAAAAEEYKKVVLLEPLTYSLTYRRLIEALKKSGQNSEAEIYAGKYQQVLAKIEAFKKHYKKGDKLLVLASDVYKGGWQSPEF